MRPAIKEKSSRNQAEITRRSFGHPCLICGPRPAQRATGAHGLSAARSGDDAARAHAQPLLEAPVQMALVCEAAQVGHLGAGQAGLQVLLGAKDAVGQQVVVRGDAEGLLELPQQGVRVGLAHLGQIAQADLVLEMRSEVFDRPNGAMGAWGGRRLQALPAAALGNGRQQPAEVGRGQQAAFVAMLEQPVRVPEQLQT